MSECFSLFSLDFNVSIVNTEDSEQLDYIDITDKSKTNTISNILHLEAVLDIAQDSRYEHENLKKMENKNIELLQSHKDRTTLSYISSSTIFKAIRLSMLDNEQIHLRDYSIGNIGLFGGLTGKSRGAMNFANLESSFKVRNENRVLRPLFIGLGNSSFQHNFDVFMNQNKSKPVSDPNRVFMSGVGVRNIVSQGSEESSSLAKNNISYRIKTGDKVIFNNIDDCVVNYAFNNLTDITNTDLKEHVKSYILNPEMSEEEALKNIIFVTENSKLNTRKHLGLEQGRMVYETNTDNPNVINWRESIGNYITKGLLEDDLLLIPSIHPDVVNTGVNFSIHATDCTNEQPMKNLDEGMYIFTTSSKIEEKTGRLSKLAYKDKYGRVSAIRNTTLNRSINYYVKEYSSLNFTQEMLDRFRLRLVEKLKDKLFIIEYKRVNFEYGSNVFCPILEHYTKLGFNYVLKDDEFFKIDEFVREYKESLCQREEVADRNNLTEYSSKFDTRYNSEINYSGKEVCKTSSICFYRVKTHNLDTFSESEMVYYDRDFMLSLAHCSDLNKLIEFNTSSSSESDIKLVSNVETKRVYAAILGQVYTIRSVSDKNLKDGLYIRTSNGVKRINQKDYKKYGVFKSVNAVKDYILAQEVAMSNIDESVDILRLKNEEFRNRIDVRNRDYKIAELEHITKLLKAQGKANETLSKLKEAELKDIIRKLEDMGPLEQLQTYLKCGLDMTKLCNNFGIM